MRPGKGRGMEGKGMGEKGSECKVDDGWLHSFVVLCPLLLVPHDLLIAHERCRLDKLSPFERRACGKEGKGVEGGITSVHKSR